MLNQQTQIDQLTQLNNELENYFRNTIIPQLFVDANLTLRKFTPPAMKQFKLHSEDIGKSINDIKDNFRFPDILDNINYVIDNGEILEKEIQTTDLRWFQMNILPYIIQQTQKTNGVIITFVDITSRIRDLRDQEKLVLEHELLLDTISHDIKTPITSLSLTVEILKKDQHKTDRFPSLLNKIESGISKLKSIIMELTSSRSSEDHLNTDAERVNIEHILEDVRLTLAPQIIETKAHLSLAITQSEIFFVRRKLRSVLYNLINNSIKYRHPERKPEINIKTFKEDEFIVIAVTDNGRGIEKESLGKIFTKYERLALDVEGTGVGLHLVREIVDLSGGKVLVESEFGKGTTFKVYLKNHNI